MKVCFLIGSLGISGGTYVIVQHASYLHDKGFDVTLAVQEPFTQEALQWHDQMQKLRCVPIDEAKSSIFDLVIATWWKTVFDLESFNALRYAYFVQSIESRFYNEKELPLMALVDSTYRLPIIYVTEATWIKKHLKTNFAQDATLVRNGIRKDIYQPFDSMESSRDGKPPRVLIEGPFNVSFKNTALAIRLAREAGAKDIWVLTGSQVNWLPKVSKVFSRVPILKTAEIYKSCDILVKLSTVEGMFGPPLEIFHCGGTAVVFDVTGHDEYIVDGYNAQVISRDSLDGVVQTLKDLLIDSERLNLLKAGALKTAAEWPSWDQSSADFKSWVEGCLSEPEIDISILKNMNATALKNYEREEKQRLLQSPQSVWRNKLVAIAKHLPPSILRWIRQIRTIQEVLFVKRKVF